MIFLIYFFFFYLGAIIGSFLNVFTQELENNFFKKNEKSFWKRINRNSACPKCKKKLNPLELFPIFSYIFLLGKCFSCKEKISPRYFFVELFTGILFLTIFIFLYFQTLFLNEFIFHFIFLSLIFSLFVVIFIFDLKHKIIPDVILLPAFILNITYLILGKILFFYELNFFKALVLGILFSLPFFLIWFFSNGRAMGFADGKIIFVLAMFFSSWQENLSFVFLSFWIGSIISLLIMFFEKIFLKNSKFSMQSEIPFGPFILLSFFSVFFLDINFFLL